jgi:hypothetical protein
MTTFSAPRVRGPFVTSSPRENSPLGVNLVPRGEICSLGGMFTPSFTPPQGWTLSSV